MVTASWSGCKSGGTGGSEEAVEESEEAVIKEGTLRLNLGAGMRRFLKRVISGVLAQLRSLDRYQHSYLT